MGYAEIIGLALAAAGTGVGIAGARQSAKAMNNQVKAGLEQQEAYQKRSTPFFEQSLAATEKTPESMAAAEARAQQTYSQAEFSDKIRLPVDKERAALETRTTRRTAAQGQAYRGAKNDWQLTDANSQANLGVISRLAGDSVQTNNILTSLAGNRGADMASMGSLLSTAGSLAAMYGAINSAKTSGNVRVGKEPAIGKTIDK